MCATCFFPEEKLSKDKLKIIIFTKRDGHINLLTRHMVLIFIHFIQAVLVGTIFKKNSKGIYINYSEN